MGYRWNRLDEPIFMAGPKPMRTEFGICQRLESCEALCGGFVAKNRISPNRKYVGGKFLRIGAISLF